MYDSRHTQLDLLIDAVSRIRGRLKSSFASANHVSGLTDIESTVLTAVAGARTPPTVAQIGRSLGHPRQVIQRAANQLIDAGLIATQPNPDHKRALLLVATAAGRDVDAAAHAHAAQIAERLMQSVDAAAVVEATALLNRIRAQIEAHLRQETP